jgi:nitrogen regulatory protein PII
MMRLVRAGGQTVKPLPGPQGPEKIGDGKIFIYNLEHIVSSPARETGTGAL